MSEAGDIVSVLGDAAMRRIERADADGLCRGASFGARLFGFTPRTERVAGACLCVMGRGQLVNKAIGLGVEGHVPDAVLDAIEAAFAEADLDPELEVWPGGDPTLEDRLAARGYRVTGRLRVLAAVPGPSFVPPETGGPVTVERVVPETADLYERTVSNGFLDRDEGAADPAERVFARGAAVSPETEAFLARLDGVPAGGGAMSVAGGVAGLFGASTLPAFRRRGVQSALLRTRLARAAALGCDLAHMKAAADSGSERNARRAGLTLSTDKAVWKRSSA